MFIDEPSNNVVRHPVFKVRGWFAYNSEALPKITLHTTYKQISMDSVPRPDVSAAIADRHVTGFSTDILLGEHLAAVKDCCLRLYVCCDGNVAGCLTLRLDPGVAATSLEQLFFS
ncbi:MAG: hypothetical protein SGI92_14225 [Bryobacteraceae bacterium]|nr:hypothetical protein [Bryobacteraceae bacterium]